jgi:hypothetical protein
MSVYYNMLYYDKLCLGLVMAVANLAQYVRVVQQCIFHLNIAILFFPMIYR